MPRLNLTAESVNALRLLDQGQVIYRDTKLQGFGVRVGTSAVAFFVEKRVDGRNVRHTLGQRGALTADQARKKAQVALGTMTSGVDLNAARKAARGARAAKSAAARLAEGHTLAALCDHYVDYLKRLGKQSATDARGIFEKWVKGSEFAALPARDFTPKHATALIRLAIEAGRIRTAAKLRSYLRAAFALAQGAETNAKAPAALVPFTIEVNPVASTAAISGANGARDVTLTELELGEVLRLLYAARQTAYDDALAAIELSVRLGGQRLAQVLRLTTADVETAAHRVTLLDGKGRRQTPRRHVLPLVDGAADLMAEILKHRRGANLFGEKDKPTSPDTVARKGVELMAQAQANVAKHHKSAAPRPKIEPRDLRRTAETMLAAMGISKDLRAQLQSHGLGGVQDRHYDRHDYMAEKRAALMAWNDHLQALMDRKAAATNVRKLSRAARTAA
jgi:hypothetical protein